MRLHSFIASGFLLAAVAGGAVSSAAPAPSAPDQPESPWVVVDYSVRGASYRVTGDVSLLSQRYSPGSTFNLIVAAVALESGELTEASEIPCRSGGESSRAVSLTLPRALRESNDDFFSQVLKRTGYEPIRRFLAATRYTPGVPEAVSSFGDLAKGEPLRVTVFEQNLFLQAFLKRELPLSARHCASLERWLAVENGKGAWGKTGDGEISPEPPRRISWFNGVARMRDGAHVITVAAITSRGEKAALERFRRYLASPRR